MAVFALTNEYITINSVDLSNHTRSGTLSVEADQLDTTCMGSSYKTMIGGLKSGTLAVEFLDDYQAASVDVTLWPLLGTVTTFEVRPDAGARSTTNPGYTGSVLIAQHNLGGKVGEVASKGLSFPTTSTITRNTS